MAFIRMTKVGFQKLGKHFVSFNLFASYAGVIKESLKIQIKKMNLEEISDTTQMFQRDRGKKNLVYERQKAARDKV